MIKSKLIAILLSGCLLLGVGAGSFLLKSDDAKVMDSSKITDTDESISKEVGQAKDDNLNNKIDNNEKENDSKDNESKEDKTNESKEESKTGNDNNKTSNAIPKETQNNSAEVVKENNTVKPVEKPVAEPAPAPKPAPKPEPKPAPAPKPTPAPAPEASDSFVAEIEQAIYTRVNQERAAAGLSALQYNNTMQHYARIKSQDMGDRNYFDHKNPEGQLITTKMQADGVSYRAWGENIAYISGMSNNAQLATKFMDNWMNSSGHRANILSQNFSSIGIGVYKIGNTYYATQEFFR